MAAHSDGIGGSSAKRAMNCAGSVRLARSMPAQPPSEFAAQGTMLHEATPLVLTGEVKKITDLIGFTREGCELTEDLLYEMLLPAVGMFDQLDRQWGGLEFIVEQRVGFVGEMAENFGTADILACNDDVTIVLDWKFGRGVQVNARENEQLLFYGAAAMETEAVADMFDDEKPVILAIGQPAFSHTLDTWQTTTARLRRFRLELLAAHREAQDENAPFRSGDWCKFCPAKPACPLLYPEAVEAARTDPTTLTPDDLSKMLEVAEVVEAWAKSVNTFAYDALNNGFEIPGYKLVEKRKTRRWVDEDKALARMARHKIRSTERFERKIISPPQLEKLCKAKGLDFALFDDVIEAKSSGSTLAKESDKRAAVQTLPKDALQALGNKLKALK